MNVESSVAQLRKENGNFIIILKYGAFYHTYDRDADLMSYVFDYKIKNREVGFPESAKDKIANKLNMEKVNYIFVEYNSGECITNLKKDFYEENKYLEIYSKAGKYFLLKNRIDEIHKYLLNNIYSSDIKQKINNIEELLYGL